MKNYRQFMNVSAIAFLAGCLTLVECLPVQADQRLKNSSWPIVVETQSAIASTQRLEPGQEPPAFQAVLREAAIYRQQHLPAGTVLRGQVIRTAPSRRLGRAGYYQIRISELELPDGRIATFTGKSAPKTYKLHHPDSQTGYGAMWLSLPVNMADWVVSIPLSAATNLSFLAVSGIGLGAQAVASVGEELLHKRRPLQRERSVIRKIGAGLFRATPLYIPYHLIRKSPEAVVAEGEPMGLYMPRKAWRTLFSSPSTASQPAETPLAEKESPVTTP
jgi:hypothetical protein